MLDSIPIYVSSNSGYPMTPDQFRRLSTIGYPNLIRISNGLPPDVYATADHEGSHTNVGDRITINDDVSPITIAKQIQKAIRRNPSSL